MNTKPKPIVGQTLYALNVGNNARHCKQELRRVQVTSVGRKYFQAIAPEYAAYPHMAVKYDLQDWREVSGYSSRWVLYETEQAWEDEKEGDRLAGEIGKVFNGYSRPAFPLSALRAAHAALFPAKPSSDHQP